MIPLTRSALEPYQQAVDELADAATVGMRPRRPVDLLSAVEARAQAGHPGAQAFLAAANQAPSWLHPAALERGRQLLVELATESSTVLLTGALLDGYASPSLTLPLLHTGRLQGDAARRLFETGQVLHNCRSPGGLAVGGIGHRSILQVRLLHSTVRHHLESRGYVGPDGGRAIHFLDMAHTALGFSHRGTHRLSALGIRLTTGEIADVQHFWRVVHHYHGVPHELLPDNETDTHNLNEFLDTWRFSDTFLDGAPLARAALRALAGRPPLFLPEAALHTLTTQFIGTTRALAWGLQPDPTWERALRACASTEAALLPLYRHLPGARPLRARLNVALHTRSLQRHLGQGPEDRAFGPIHGENERYGPGLEAPFQGKRLAG
jgi:hypothetical protein